MNALTAAEWWRLGLMFRGDRRLHLVGYRDAAVEPARLQQAAKGILHHGVGLTAYGTRSTPTIAAIIQLPPASDGSWRQVLLSLGPCWSSGSGGMLVTGLKAIVGPVENDSSTLHHYTA